MSLKDLNVDIYYDGSDRISDYIDQVDGVTTNIGFLKKSNSEIFVLCAVAISIRE